MNAFIICLIVLAAVLIVAIVLALRSAGPERTPGYEPEHAVRPARPVPSHAKREFPDPREASDPDGSAWMRLLRTDNGWKPAPVARQPHFRHEAPPSLADLVRAGGPAAPGMMPMLPPDPPPAETAPLPVAVCELGMPTSEYVDALFAEAEAEFGVLADGHLGSDEEGRAA